MGPGSALRELATFVEACESGDGAVTGVCFAECLGPTDDAVTAAVELTLSPDATGSGGSVSLRSRIDDDGRLTLALESGGAVLPTEGHGATVEPTDVTVDGDGTIAVTLSATVPMDSDGGATPSRVTGEPASSNGGGESDSPDDGSPCDTARGEDERDSLQSGPEDRSAAASDADRDRDVPPFRDRELLASVYESEDTFAEMADRLEMDVTAETVRRYMIDYDIHQPDSYDTSGDGADREGDRGGESGESSNVDGGGIGSGSVDGTASTDSRGVDGTAATDSRGVDGTAATDSDGSPVVLSDGIGLPDDVTVDTLIDSVKRSNTIYEVTQDVDMDRHEALDMLQDLNLLDLVVGRLSTETDRHITREDVVSRLREVSAAQ